MTWPVRSKLLGTFTGSATLNVDVTLGTVPAGKTWLIKDLSAYNNHSVARTIYFWMNPGGARVVVFGATAVPAGGLAITTGRSLVLPAGGTVGFFTSVTGSILVQASGAQLG